MFQFLQLYKSHYYDSNFQKQKYLLRLGNKYVTSKSPLRFLYSFALYLFTHFHKPKDIN